MEQQVLYVKTCPECEKTFNTQVEFAVFCSECNHTAQVLYLHYLILQQRWNVTPANPNPLVARVLNVGIKPIRKLTNV